jgi:hypothetical protein
MVLLGEHVQRAHGVAWRPLVRVDTGSRQQEPHHVHVALLHGHHQRRPCLTQHAHLTSEPK